MSSKLYVLCNNSIAVTAVAEGSTFKYVYQKSEHSVVMMPHETFTFPGGQVQLFVQQHAIHPCLLHLPSPFNHSLKLGSVLGFQVSGGLDFVALWNECCAANMTWQHSRPKKLTDPLQKLGLPAKLSEFLREQVVQCGLEVPVGSDASDEDAADVSEGQQDDGSGRGSSTCNSSDNDSDATSNKDELDDYYTTTEDEQEEEEAEDEPEPDELLEDE